MDRRERKAIGGALLVGASLLFGKETFGWAIGRLWDAIIRAIGRSGGGTMTVDQFPWLNALALALMAAGIVLLASAYRRPRHHNPPHRAAMPLDVPEDRPRPMTDETWLNPSKGPSEGEVAIDYIKANDFKVIWADGVIGGVTPNGHVHFSVYAERHAIPRRQVFKLNMEGQSGRLGQEVLSKQISRGSIVREMACDVMLSPQAAESLGKWLLERVSEVRAFSQEVSK